MQAGLKACPACKASYAQARPLTIDKGQFLFQSRCSACHTIGAGDRLGPDLLGVTTRRERSWLARFLAQPEQMPAEGDPLACRVGRKGKAAELGLKPVSTLRVESKSVVVGAIKAYSALFLIAN